MGVKKLGHVGIYTHNLEEMRAFYRDVVGLAISDEDLERGLVFMSSRPDEEHHEFAIFRVPPDETPTKVQQLSFSCENLEDVRSYYQRFKAAGVRFDRVVSHGNAIGLYFFDPDGNRCEVYWTTPYKARQPFGVAIDVRKEPDAILREVEEMVRQFGATGASDPQSFVRQREELVADGVLV